MEVLLLCWFVVMGAAWLMTTQSGSLLTAAYLVVGSVVLVRMLISALTRHSILRSRLLTWVMVLPPVVWYGLRLLIEPIPEAASHHLAELVGAVLPGAMLGIATAMAVNARMPDVQPKSRQLQARRASLAASLLAGFVCVLGAFLAGNAEEGILLVSAALLAGAETYQTLGDALIVAMLVAFVLATLDFSVSVQAWPARIALYFQCAATLACSVLIGSNKLLLIASLVAAVLLWRAFADGQDARRRRAVAVGVGFVLLAALGIALSNSEVAMDLLALTRLLDYGNVESLLDTPSIAARLEIFGECGQRQLQLAPILGDLAAEFRTCGDGHYIHSLISIQTHLGLVGSVLFILALGRGAWLLTVVPCYRVLWLPYLTVTVIGLIGAYFTWLPFWFLMGMIGALYRPSVVPASVSNAHTWANSSHGPALRACR